MSKIIKNKKHIFVVLGEEKYQMLMSSHRLEEKSTMFKEQHEGNI